MHFKIQRIENEKFYRYTRGPHLKRVSGSEKRAVKISVLCPSRAGHVFVEVRRPTRARAVTVVKEVLGISDARWATMLRHYEASKRRAAEHKAALQRRAARWRLAMLNRQVAAVEKQMRKL